MRAEVAQATESSASSGSTPRATSRRLRISPPHIPESPPRSICCRERWRRRRKAPAGWLRWRAVAALLGVWFVVLLASEAMRGVWASHRARALTERDRDALQQLLSERSTHSGYRIAYTQMRSHIGGRGDVGFDVPDRCSDIWRPASQRIRRHNCAASRSAMAVRNSAPKWRSAVSTHSRALKAAWAQGGRRRRHQLGGAAGSTGPRADPFEGQLRCGTASIAHFAASAAGRWFVTLRD